MASSVKAKEVAQCKSCPWRVGCDPDKDIPNYRRELHCNLDRTIRSGMESMAGNRRIMACHLSKSEASIVCAGWLANQLGPGNNIGLRFDVMCGRSPVPVVDGPQHERFEDTLPTKKRKRR